MYEVIIPRMATINATAEMFGLSPYFVRQRVRSGEIVAVKAGNKYLVNLDKFSEYLNSNTLQSDEPQESGHCGIRPISSNL